MPDTFDELVIWHCEDCKPSPPYHFTSPTHDPSPPQDEDPPSLALGRTTPSPPYHFTSPTHDPSPPQDEDPPSLALVRTTPSPPYHVTSPTHDPSPPQDEDPSSFALVRITRPRTKRQNKMKHVSSEASEKDNKSVSPFKRLNRCIVLGLTKPVPKYLQLQEKVVASLEPVKTTKSQQSIEPPSDSDSRANQVTPKSAELDTSCFLTKGIVKRKRDTARVAAKPKKQKTERSIEHSSCESSCTDAALKNEEDITHTEDGLTCGPDHDKLVSKSISSENESNGCAYASQSDYLENDDDKVARPILEPTWWGSFCITETDYDVFEGFRCHRSIKTGKKVHDEATTLPPLLSFEMHSRALLWPKSFFDSPPADDKIAIYFFPCDTRNKRFEQLVNDMIDEDLAMKTDSRNAELLIFTSKVLPQEYWRFQGNYYLWGVFRRKKNDVPVANHRKNGNEVLTEEEPLKRAKTIECHSPQSPLCTNR
ncbi:uncharacterized protein LOC143578035 [Bidens hawaiensis]|uniref:uncharacterized protein LOC143578035 n=1 Tax=Bidens hawaiensis TaxID=980011 RepID=UPI00404AA5C3